MLASGNMPATGAEGPADAPAIGREGEVRRVHRLRTTVLILGLSCIVVPFAGFLIASETFGQAFIDDIDNRRAGDYTHWEEITSGWRFALDISVAAGVLLGIAGMVLAAQQVNAFKRIGEGRRGLWVLVGAILFFLIGGMADLFWLGATEMAIEG